VCRRLRPILRCGFLFLSDITSAFAPYAKSGVMSLRRFRTTLPASFTVSQFGQNHNASHCNAVKRIFKYLAGTTELGVTYGTTDVGLIGYTDADWGGCRDTRKSTGANLFLLYGGPISWCSKRQQTVALSST